MREINPGALWFLEEVVVTFRLTGMYNYQGSRRLFFEVVIWVNPSCILRGLKVILSCHMFQ